MKHKLILFITLLTLFSSKVLKAQDEPYLPLLDTGKLWIEAKRLEFGGFKFTELWIGDRIIYNDTVYYELYGINTEPFYMREDTLERKVYIDCSFYPEPCEDVLLYDFSLQVGDSVDYGEGYLYRLEVVETESISEINRKIYYLQPVWDMELPFAIWIEGIGSKAGVLQPKSNPGLYGMGMTELNCFYQNEELQYQSYSASVYGCNFEYLAIDKIEKNYLTIYPNPVTDILNIKIFNEQLNDIKFEIIDIFGKVCKIGIINNTEFQVNVSDLPKGIYIIRFNYDNTINNQKFIKL